MTEDNVRQQFEEFFKSKTIHAIRAMFDNGYENADLLYQREKDSLLQLTKIGKEIWADVLRASMANSARIFCIKGILPFKFATKTNHAKNSSHVELTHDAGFKLFLARVESPREVPHSALYRPNIDVVQMSLFDDEPADTMVRTYTATYGDSGKHEFCFGNVGVAGKREWIVKRSLEQGPYRYTNNQEDDEMLISLTDSFEEMLKNGKYSQQDK